MTSADDRYFEAEFTLYGPIEPETANMIFDDLLQSVENHGALMGGGFVEVDDAGIPPHLAGWRRALYQLGDWLKTQAVLA